MRSSCRYIGTVLVVLFALLGLSCGSVYYNTFFNAKKAFDSAEESRKKKKGGRVDQANYRTAIEKSLKVIEYHPNSKYYDDALFVLGVSYFHVGQFAKAERRFREILANYENSEFVNESTVYLAKSKLELGDIDDAMDAFEAIFASDYQGGYKAEAATSLGKYYFDAGEYAESESYFRAVRDSLGDEASRKQAQMYIADGRFETFRFDDGLGSYLQVLGMDPDRDEKFRALYQAAICSYRLQRIDDGMDYLNQLIEDEVYFDSLGTLKLRIAQGYEYLDDLDLACETLEDVGLTAEKGQIAAEAYYRLGLIYQYDYDELLEAKSYYDQCVQKHRTGESGKDALQRSSDIGKLETFSRSVELDSAATQDVIDDAAYTQYALAELYWFKLNKPDSAIAEMQYLVDSFPTAYDAPNGMIALAEMHREHSSDSSTADSIIRMSLAKYPNSDFAGRAIDILGLADSEADTGYAEVYIHKAEDFILDGDQFDSAKYYYQYVFDNYPDSKYHLQARFNLIWLTETYESPGDSTVFYAYQEFADSFPNTELGRAARQKLSAAPQARPQRQFDDEQDEEDDRRKGKGEAHRDRYGEEEEEREPGPDLEDDPLGGYSSATEAMYRRPNGDTIILLELNPTETLEPFEFPAEAAGLPVDDIEMYFHIQIDFSGRVIAAELKTLTQYDVLNERAKITVASMTFNSVDVTTLVEIQDLRESEDGSAGYWFVYKFPVTKPDFLR